MSGGTRRRALGALVVLVTAVVLGAAGCSSGGSDAAPPGSEAAPASTSTVPAGPIRVLVTNDDGVGADGIDAVVEGLRKVDGVEVTVVAPAENQSGTAGKTTDGPLTVTDATTKSGYPAKAVQGFPADTIVWAIDQKGIDFTPDLVVSGINLGQNIGPTVDLSGTVGAARAAATRKIPALAASQGLGTPADFPAGVAQVLAWFDAHRDAIADGSLSADTVANLNVPTCTTGSVRGQVDVPVAAALDGYADPVDCASTATNPTDDIQAFLEGFAPLSALALTPAA